MPLQLKITQADLRGQNDQSINSAFEELQDWLTNDAPGAPIGNPETVSTNTTATDDTFLASVMVSY